MSMTLLQRVEIGSAGAATIDFTSIPQNYTDLQLVVSARADGGSYPGEISWNMGISFNGSTSNFSTRHLNGSGSSASTSAPVRLAGYMGGASATSNTFGNAVIHIPNYTSSTYKSFSADSVSENNATTTYSNIVAGLWSNTAAITSISLDTEYGVGGNWVQGSTASLYGISRQSAIGKPKAIGGAITFANGFWYHTFTGSGTFSPQQDINCEALIIAGGGGGAGAYGGAGAGGVLYSTLSASSKIGYSVTIGAGGIGGNVRIGNNGTNSSFGTLTAIGGGAGIADGAGRAGGSGGGAGGPNYSVGVGTSGQGNNGGLGAGISGYAAGGGGGGAGAVGGNSPGNQNGGNGGAGAMFGGWAQATNTGSSGYYAGGGGGAAYGNGGTSTGGSGGIGGGGQGAAQVLSSYLQYSTAGLANTGSGGGTGMNNSGSNGGSGIVIIRYPAE